MDINRFVSYRTNKRTGMLLVTLTNNRVLFLFVVFFSFLYLIRDLFGVFFPDIVFSGVCAMAFFFLNDGAALGMYIFTTALTVPQNEIMLLYVFIFCIKRIGNGSIHFHKGMFSMVAMLLVLQMVDMSIFSGSSAGSVIYDYITKMLYIIIPMLWYMVDISQDEYKNAILCYIWGSLLGAIIVVILTANQVGWETLFKSNQYMRIGVVANENEGMQSTYNANQLGGMMAISISLALVLMDKKKLNVFLGFIICGIAITVVALTKSRTGLLCSAGAVGLYILYTIFCSKKVFRGVLFIVSIALIILLLLYIEPELFNGIMSRFEDQEDITNGRSDLFMIYINEWLDNPWSILFGYGIGSFQDVVITHNVPHNAITDILISWGLLGFIMIICIMCMHCIDSIKGIQKKNILLAVIPFIVAVVISMAGQYLTTGYPHMRLCYLLISMKALSDNGKKNVLLNNVRR